MPIARRRHAIVAAYSAALAVLVMGPLLGNGYLLWRDAVATPRSYLTDTALGLGDAAPRAVPQDAVLAVLSTVVDGGLVVRVILVAALWLAGWGAAGLVAAVQAAGASGLSRAMGQVGLGPQLVAATVAIWNPYVAERLLQGHWSLLVGYAALPWVALAARRDRCGVLVGLLAVAGLTPTGGLLAVVVAVVTVRAGRLPVVLAGAAVAAAPWLVAAVLGSGTEPADPAGVAAFAARAEPGLGTLGSLAGLGGIWNADAVPGSRTGGFAVLGTLLLLAVVGLGVPALLRGRDRTALALLALAVLAVLAPALAATPWGLSAAEWAMRSVPGAGLLRDAQKWVALAMPGYALCAAAGCRALAARTTPAAAIPLAALVLLALPDLAWGVGGVMHPVHYPPGWTTVAARVQGDGDVAVLPAGMFRRFPFTDVPVLDPAPRLLPADVLQTGDLEVAGRVVAGEGSRAREVQAALLHGDPPSRLSELGVGWVVVERTTPGPLGDSQRTLDAMTRVYSDDDLALYAAVPPVRVFSPSEGEKRAQALAHLGWVFALMVGLASALSGLVRALLT